MTGPHIPVVGLDLSLTASGVATAGGCRTVGSPGRKGASLRVRHARLADIATRVCLAVSEAAAPRAALVVIEGPSFGSRGGQSHERAGLFWVVIDELISAGHLVAEVPPATLKKYALGRGVGDKGAMVDAAARRLPGIVTGGQNDVVDALWLRAMGCDRLGFPLAVLPVKHREALDAVVWPDVDTWAGAA